MDVDVLQPFREILTLLREGDRVVCIRQEGFWAVKRSRPSLTCEVPFAEERRGSYKQMIAPLVQVLQPVVRDLEAHDGLTLRYRAYEEPEAPYRQPNVEQALREGAAPSFPLTIMQLHNVTIEVVPASQ